MKSGRILIFALFATGILGSLVSDASIYRRLLYLSSLLIGGGWLWTRISTSGLIVTRRSRSLRGNVGDIFEEHFEVENANRWRSSWVEVINETPLPFSSGSRLLVSIGGRQTRTYLARTWLTQRGSFLLGPTTLQSGDPLGLFRRRKTFSAHENLIVLPMLVDVTSFPAPPGLLPGGRVVRQKAIGITPHAAGIREYAPGDALRRIHWAQTARRQKLMVKEFDHDPQAEVWIFLDAESGIQATQKKRKTELHWDGWMFGRRPDFSLPPSTIEYAVTIAASLTHYFTQQRRAVGLISAAQIHVDISADRSVRQEEKILETLAFIEASGTLSIGSLVAAQAGQLPQGSSAVLITSSVRKELVLAVDDLLRRNIHPTVVLLDAKSFGGPEGSDALEAALKVVNVPVCRILCDADLADILSGFSANNSYQETMKWFEPSIP